MSSMASHRGTRRFRFDLYAIDVAEAKPNRNLVLAARRDNRYEPRS